MPLGDYTLYSPPPPAGGAILSFILNVLKGEAPRPPAQSPALQGTKLQAQVCSWAAVAFSSSDTEDWAVEMGQDGVF